MTTIIVEQNAVHALKLADRAVILDTGQIVFDCTAQDVLNNDTLRAEYLAVQTVWRQFMVKTPQVRETRSDLHL
jgi:ABC-type lipopolysaccharide export system ATPase subunit